MPQASRGATAGRWAWVEIDLEAIRKNVRAFRSFLRPPCKLMAVVKANAYGHGAVPTALAARAAGADAFGVATVDEAIELRQSGIDDPILILAQPPVDAIDALIEYKVMPSVYDLEFVALLGQAADRAGTEARYHLALDTGMTRIGVAWDAAVEFMEVADRLSGVRLDGTFTHFATAERPSDWDFALQLRRFRTALDAMRSAGFSPGVAHCANTAAIVLHPEAHMSMVRLGVGMFGMHPGEATRDKIDLVPAMSVKARATRVIMPPVGEGVGYGMTYRVARPSIQIATLPLGYADGLSRGLSNKMEVLYGGQRWRQVGNICMDQCMVEVEPQVARIRGVQVKPIETGDEVVLVGRQGDQQLTLDQMATSLGTINYELACRFDMRLPKRYVNAGTLLVDQADQES